MADIKTAAESSDLGSVANALRLLRLLSAEPSVRVADAAEKLGIARSTAHRLLSTLRNHDFAAQDRINSSYRMGPVFTDIALSALRRLDIRGAARPVLEELRAQTGESVTLAVLDGQYVRVIDGLEGTKALRVGDRTGVVLPSSSTAVGKAILAWLSEAEFAVLYTENRLPILTPSSIAELQALRKELEEVRAKGYAVNHEESEADISAVSVAVRDSSRRPIGAIAVLSPTARFTPEAEAQWAELLRTSARMVERSLNTLRESWPSR